MQFFQAYKPLGGFRGAGLAIMALAWAAVITLLLTWAPSSVGKDTAAPDTVSGVPAQTAGAIEDSAGARRALNDAPALNNAPARPTCAALGKNALAADVAERSPAGGGVGCGIPDTLAKGTPDAISAANE